MADGVGSVIGLTLARINGIYDLDVKNATWEVRRALQQHITGGGVKEAAGTPVPTGTFDEVIAKKDGTNWASLQNFSIEIMDKETRKIVVAAFVGCNWSSISGSSDLASANSARKVSWGGTRALKF